MFSHFKNYFSQSVCVSEDIQWKILLTLAVLVIAWLVKYISSISFIKNIHDPTHRYRVKKTVAYLSYLIAFGILILVWVDGIRDVATFIGLVSAGLAVALRDPLENLAGWLFILWRKPFSIGDRIEICGCKGDVIDQRLFVFTMIEVGNWVDEEQSTGRLINIPNGKVFTDPLANYNKGFNFIWNEIVTNITFESNWEKAIEILEHSVNEHCLHLSQQAEQEVKKNAEEMMIFYNKLTPKVYLAVNERGVQLTIRYLCEIRTRRGTAELIWKSILKEFAHHNDINFAYPTTRLYYNHTEGKQGTRPTHLGKEMPSIIDDFIIYNDHHPPHEQK